jgi:hypothetical protein
MGLRKGYEMRIRHNSSNFVYGKSAKMSKIDIQNPLRSVFCHFIENVLLEWYPRLFPEERHLAPAFIKNHVISEFYLFLVAKP